MAASSDLHALQRNWRSRFSAPSETYPSVILGLWHQKSLRDNSSWLLSNRLLCDWEYDNMSVIHRCQNVTSRANLCFRYDKVGKAEVSAPGDFREDTYIQGAPYLCHAAANSNNLSRRGTRLKMQIDGK
ncbi:uncharacterized protein AAES06_022156 isoform 1-T1 [Glossophaga mutica]